MKRSGRRILLALLLAVGATSVAPAPASATCTGEYEDCINAARKKSWVFRQMEYIECFAQWAGCVKDYLE